MYHLTVFASSHPEESTVILPPQSHSGLAMVGMIVTNLFYFVKTELKKKHLCLTRN